MVRQAQSREKLLQKKLEEGLTEKPQRDAEWDFSFPDPGELPTPVLMIQDVSFAYPNSEPLYHNLDLGIDLQSRIALVGPNGAGKTTFVKLMTGELQPTSGAVRPHSHLRMAKFTQHFEDVLDLEQNALEWIHALYPKVFTCVESTSASGAPDNSSLSHFSAMTRPCWPRRAARNRHRHAIEQASRRWRGGRRDDAANAP